MRKLQGIDFIRDKIRKLLGNYCSICGKEWQEDERRLDVHHINKELKLTRKYDKIDDLSQFKILCHKCHLQLHHNVLGRPYKLLIKNYHQSRKIYFFRYDKFLDKLKMYNCPTYKKHLFL